MAFTLPPLPYAYDALEPHIDAETMQIHHNKHHGAYVTNLNKAVAGTEAEGLALEEILRKVSKFPEAIRNNAGGHFNHSLFWINMAPGIETGPSGKLATVINATWGSPEEFKQKFAAEASARFGSGWAWLIKNKEGKLQITSTPNQDNPLMDVAEVQGEPLFGIDLWEHAYYLKYESRRPEYISAWWNLVNWEDISKRFLL